jgi:hypothetical protein
MLKESEINSHILITGIIKLIWKHPGQNSLKGKNTIRPTKSLKNKQKTSIKIWVEAMVNSNYQRVNGELKLSEGQWWTQTISRTIQMWKLKPGITTRSPIQKDQSSSS